MATTDDDEENNNTTDTGNTSSDITPSLISNPTTSASQNIGDNTQNIKDLVSKNALLKAAQTDIATSQEKAIKPEDINALQKSQNIDQLTKMFMNFAGATNRVNAAPYTNIVGQGTEQQQQRLGLQQNLANQALNRGLAEQRVGLEQVNLEKQNQPVPPQMLDQIDAVRAKGGLDPIDRSVSYPMYMMPQLMSMNTQAAKLGVAARGQDIKANTAAAGLDVRAQKLVPMTDANGNIVQGLTDVRTQQSTALPGTVLPQGMKIDQQQLNNFSKNLKSGQIDPIQAHTAIQNYDHAFDNLTPAEATKADSLARRQIGAIANKFDQGVHSNVITNANQLLGTIAKMEQTQEFNTPENPEIGKAAFQRTKSALAFATMSQAGKTRPSNFATQFSLGNSFGANIPFTGVPQEKIQELRKLTSQGLGGAIQSAIATTPNQNIAKKAAQGIFGDTYQNYVNDYQGMSGGQPQAVGQITPTGRRLTTAAELLGK